MSKDELIQKTAETTEVTAYDSSKAYGFEETKSEDIIIPRVKVIQALSPERQDNEANEGDIINSLTKENMKGKRFIPVKQFYSNIYWNPDRDDELRIFCRSFDGRIGQNADGTCLCEKCKKNQFDNTKVGKDSQPLCTAYLNFLGFFEDSPMPVVLSFAKTNYNEGKKLLSIAKSMRCAAWNYFYTLESKKVAKNKNQWYIITTRMDGQTSPELRSLAYNLFRTYETSQIKADYEDVITTEAEGGNAVNSEMASEM